MLFCTKLCEDGVAVLDVALAQKISSENLSNSKKNVPFDESVFETTSAISELVKAFANHVADMTPSLCPCST